jgi:hypothetical protein
LFEMITRILSCFCVVTTGIFLSYKICFGGEAMRHRKTINHDYQASKSNITKAKDLKSSFCLEQGEPSILMRADQFFQ